MQHYQFPTRCSHCRCWCWETEPLLLEVLRLVTVFLLSTAGEVLGDVFEVSTIRREDYEFHKGKSEYEDILQCNNLPSSATPRGHQTPAAFLIMASGLDKVTTQSDLVHTVRLGEVQRLTCTVSLMNFSMVWTPRLLCHTRMSTSPGPVGRSLVCQQGPPSSPWQPTTSCLMGSKQIPLNATQNCSHLNLRNSCHVTQNVLFSPFNSSNCFCENLILSLFYVLIQLMCTNRHLTMLSGLGQQKLRG